MTQANAARTTMNIDAVCAHLKSLKTDKSDCLAAVLNTAYEPGESVDKAVLKAIFDVCLPDMPSVFRKMECQVVTTLA